MSAFTMEKIALFEPMEGASVRITAAVNRGLRRKWRAANLRFCAKASIDEPPGESAGFSGEIQLCHTLRRRGKFRCNHPPVSLLSMKQPPDSHCQISQHSHCPLR